jgi:hypothetical protein
MAEYTNIDKYTVLRDIASETWKRILLNLPHLYKTKGTLRSLQSLITCYGIPSTLLYVREFGGPDVSESVYNNYKFDNFTHVLPFISTNGIQIAWATSSIFNRFPSVLQLRFSATGSTYTRANSMSLVEVPASWSLQVMPTTNEYGKIKFTIYTGSAQYAVMTTSEMPIYDNKFTFINLQKGASGSNGFDFELDAKKYIYGEIFYAVSSSLFISSSDVTASWLTTGSLFIASTSIYAQPFSGNLDEFRLWETPLAEGVINSHVKFPESYIGNTLTSSFYDLLLRWSFNDPITFNSQSMVTTAFKNSAPSKGYDATPTFYGWPEENTFPYNYRLAEYEAEAHTFNIGARRQSSNKVRIESASLSGPLSIFERREISQYDEAQLDSNKVGIYFTPTEPVNENIIKSLALESAGDLIGKYSDMYSESYSDLETLSKLFWGVSERRISVAQYLQYIQNYDKSLFENIKKLIPARVKPILGILYEPTLLERPKAKYVKPALTQHQYDNNVNIIIPGFTSSYEFKTASLNIYQYVTSSGDNFEKTNIYSIITASIASGISGSLFIQIDPVVNFETGVIYYLSDYFRTPLTQSYSFTTYYNDRHYVRYLGYAAWEKRIKHIGCANTKGTTIDGKESIETWVTDTNTLIAKDDGITKLQIE